MGTLLRTHENTLLDLVDLLRSATGPIQRPVRVGAGGLTAWLLAAPLPAEALTKRLTRLKEQARLDQRPIPQRQLDLAGWTILLTNIPDLTFDQAFALARIRWQIELLFKLWKSHAKLLTSRSALPIRQQVEGLAKLIGVILAHWLLLVSGWSLDALSPLDALRLLRAYLPALWRALPHPRPWLRLMAALRADLAHLSPLSSRRAAPRAFQLWRHFDYVFPSLGVYGTRNGASLRQNEFSQGHATACPSGCANHIIC